MGKVYMNSAVNIAATASSNSHGGLFVSRNPRLIESTSVLPAWLESGNTHHLVKINTFHLGIEESPLCRRAWVLQERLLAPRNLHFGHDQLFWECNQLKACEGYPIGLPPTFDTTYGSFRDEDLGGRLLYDETEQPKLPDQLRISDSYDDWTFIVERYTRSLLTKSEDKLIAINGVAGTMQRLLNDEYFAGLWRQDLPRLMLWRVLHGKQVDGTPSYRPLGYHAPTWSWASVDREVTFPYPSTEPLKVNVRILGIYVLKKEGDETGRVIGGRLDVKGLVFSPTSRGILASGPSDEMEIHIDDKDAYWRNQSPKDEERILLIVCTWHGRDRMHWFVRYEGLILVPTGDPVMDEEERVEYQRVGSFTAGQMSFQEYATPDRVWRWRERLREMVVSIV